MSRILTNELAARFYYKGQNHKKQGFRPLKLCAVVIGSITFKQILPIFNFVIHFKEAVRRQSRSQDLKENDVETKIKNRLRHASTHKDQTEEQASNENKRLISCSILFL